MFVIVYYCSLLWDGSYHYN